jgi:lipopolysaccharide export system permease protein
MKTLSKYVLKEHLSPFIGAIVITMFVMVMDFILDILNLIISKGVPVDIVLRLFVLNFAWMLALAVPMSCLVAGLMAFGRLTEDGEITAASSSGIPPFRLMIAPLIAALALSLFMIYFSDRILPESNYRAKLLLGDIKRKKPTLAIKERVFIEDFPDAGLYIEEVNDKTNELYGITVFDGQNPKVPRIVKANYGTMAYDDATDALTLELHDGTIHEIDERDPSKYTRVDFDIQTIRFKNLGLKMETRESTNRGDRELTIADMKFRIAQKDTAVESSLDAIREVSDKTFRAAFSPGGKDTPADSVLSTIPSAGG